MIGRLFLQLALVAAKEAEEFVYEARSPDWSEYARLRALSQRFAYRAHEHGWHGGSNEAFEGDDWMGLDALRDVAG